MPRRVGLDGLRGVAVLLVVGYHLAVPGLLPGGAHGVDVFFALSGFLITAILVAERHDGRLDVPAFYARRAARLLPALGVLLAVWVLVLLAAHDTIWLAATPATGPRGVPVEPGPALRDVGLAAVYLGNWVHALGDGRAPIGHLWSLAVEEQFYLLWPLALVVVLRASLTRARVAVLGLVCVSAALPFVYWNGGTGYSRIYFGTDTRVVGLLLGALLALGWQQRRAAGAGERPGLRWRAALGVAVLAYLVVDRSPFRGFATVAPAVSALAACQVVALLVERPAGRAARVMSWRPLVWVGQRSYGLYLWHYLFATWLHPVRGWWRVPATLALSFAVTVVSWTFVEQPVQRAVRARLRSRRVSRRDRSDGGADRVCAGRGHLAAAAAPEAVPGHRAAAGEVRA
jgi:peptidoglycan/LPS O-acetylase OafA/YrhL